MNSRILCLMRKIHIVSILTVFLAILVGCAAIPDDYRRDFLPDPDAGYRVLDEHPTGFDLEVYYFKRGVLLKREKLIEDAKATYVQIAIWLSSRIGRTPKNISKQSLDVKFRRTLVDGRHEVHVIGKVVYR